MHEKTRELPLEVCEIPTAERLASRSWITSYNHSVGSNLANAPTSG